MAFEQFSGFRAVREVDLPQVRAFAREFEHLPSGLKLIHLACDDPENVFALAFATPPDASTGVPHILEHAVLAGSEKFPVKEPFFELVKSSPAGFINAMTSDVWTIYPIATTLEGDFWNLADVYADAVFHPLLTRDTFEREGHHLELQEPGNLESPLVRSGIVYNEMKGAYSNTEMVMAWRLKNHLFRGGALGVDSGGDPKSIPQLTWEGLRDFYSRYYAPGNCTLFLYGDIPTEKHLEYWGEKLKDASPAPSLAARPVFEPWSAPQMHEETFGIEPGSDPKAQTFLSLRWRCGDGLDRFEEAAWGVLSFLLSGHDGAPLKKALIASKLGADVFRCGVEDVESELTFHVALKGSEPERADEFLAFTLRTLESIAQTGFSREEVETALRQSAYSTLEVLSLFPLHLAMDAARYATCGADPLDVTRSREMLEKVRELAYTDPQFWSRLIQERLLDNPHRLLVVFKPDAGHAAREEKREKDELAALKAKLDDDQLREIDTRAQELEASQNELNSPEALATLPRLAKSDLPEAPREIPTMLETVAGFDVLHNDVFANGVVYLQAAVDIRDLPAHLWKWVPRYTDAFSKLGAAGQTWEQIAARRAASTGGLRVSPRPVVHAETEAPVIDLRFDLKTLDADFDAALDVWADLVFALDPSDRERLHEVQVQAAAAARDRLVNDALSSALRAAARDVSPVGWLGDLWYSPQALAEMRDLSENFSTRAEELIAGIEAIRDFILQSGRWTWSFTGSDEVWTKLEAKLTQWRERMREGGAPDKVTPQRAGETGQGALALGLAAPLDVQFCARVFPGPSKEQEPLVDLGLDLMGFDYFLPEIRLKGNAYGGGCRMNSDAAIVSFHSYRDPRLSETLNVFDGATDWVKAQQWNDDDLERALLGNVADAVPAIRPGEATGTTLHRLRRGETPEMRAEAYKKKLAATPQEVQDALLSYFSNATPTAATAVAASRVALEKANAEMEKAGQKPLAIVEMLPETASGEAEATETV